MFYIDIMATADDPNCQCAIGHLRELSPFVKVLGTYATGHRGERFTRRILYDIHPYLGTTQVQLSATRTQSLLRPADLPVTHRGLTVGQYGMTLGHIAAQHQLKIGIVGFGNFGQFLAKTFARKHPVVGTSRSDQSEMARSLGVAYVPGMDFAKMIAEGVNVFVICTSILSFESVMKRFSRCVAEWKEDTSGAERRNILLVDVLSVKEWPRKVLLDLFADDKHGAIDVDILCTHPMFGPESGRYGWQGLPFVYEVVRCRQLAKCQAFLNLFEAEGCRMIELSCGLHDKYAASTQFITHLTGRVLGKQRVESTPIDTKGFQSLLQLVDNTVKDSFDLFCGLYRFNANSTAQLESFTESLAEIKLDLRRATAAGAGADAAAACLSSLAEGIKESKTVQVHALTKQKEAEGKQVISLCVGEPDFDPPAEVLQATARAATETTPPLTRYTAVAGTLELRKAIAGYLTTEKKTPYGPEHIVVANGAKQAVYQSVLAMCQEADEVVIPTPAWVSYVQIVRMARARPVLVPCAAEDGYVLSAESLAAVLTPKTKMIMLCNPSNPTGAVMPEATLRGISALLMLPQHQHIYVLSDEIYERLTYDTPHVAFASIENMWDRTLTVNGFSKAFAMTGYRLGYLAAPSHIAKSAAKLQGQITSCASSISQAAGLAALTQVPPSWMQATVQAMREKRDICMQALADVPGVTCTVTPEGAFYVMPSVESHFGKRTPSGLQIDSSESFCTAFLEECDVALVPGDDFEAPGTIRISYAASRQTIREAISRLKTFVNGLT
mmetsp:Transcript_20380/g.58178  ORF Transcript_20380/g.58178 Transcript_20380/m.58178 type:complete len:783 (+) Transcript_20380:159-2507(+)